MSPYNFKASECIPTKLFPGDVPGGGGDKMGVTFGRPAPYNLGGRKKRPKFRAFSDNFPLWSRISPERIDIANRKSILSTRAPSTFGEKNTWTLVHKQKSYMGSCMDQPKRTFCGRLHFGLWGMPPPQIFTRVTDWPRLASAHHNWDGIPLKINPENLRFGLKFSVWALNFGDSGSILTKLFSRDMPRGRGDKMGIAFGRHAP